MILTVLLYILSYILKIVITITDSLADGWSIWPDTLLNGLTYFFTSLMTFDFLLNIVALLTVLKWLFGFLAVYVSIKLLLKIINWFRGSGELDI